MPTVTATIADFNMSSSWTNKNGAYTVRPSQSTATKQFTISGISDGGKVTAATFAVTIGSPLTGAAILRINEQNATTGNYTQDVKSIVTGNGTFEFTFVFKANGDPSMSDGSHYGNITFSGCTITVTYEAGTPEPEPAPEIILASDAMLRQPIMLAKDEPCHRNARKTLEHVRPYISWQIRGCDKKPVVTKLVATNTRDPFAIYCPICIS